MRVRKAAEKTIRTLENDARIAEPLENLQQYLEQQKRVAGSQSADEVQMRDYERTVRLLRDQVESHTTRYQEAIARESDKAAPADARIVSRAVAPQLPTYPRKAPIILFATLAAIVLSAGSLIIREMLSGRALWRPSISFTTSRQCRGRAEEVRDRRYSPNGACRPRPALDVSEAEERAFAQTFLASTELPREKAERGRASHRVSRNRDDVDSRPATRNS